MTPRVQENPFLHDRASDPPRETWEVLSSLEHEGFQKGFALSFHDVGDETGRYL